MIRKEKRAGKKFWILTVFAVFIAVAMSFVSWLIYAVFSQSYREIKQQYYGVVSKQIVEDIENSIRNGKQIERFYGMDKVLNDMLRLISTEQIPINTAITDTRGNVLYSSYEGGEDSADFDLLLTDENVLYNLDFSDSESTSFRITSAGEFEIMLQPIYDRQGAQIGAMSLFYRLSDIETELIPQKQSSDMVTMTCIGATIVLLVLYFLLIPRSVTESADSSGDPEAAYKQKQRENRYMFLIPVFAIMAGLLVQCMISYNEYQKRYKDVMFEGAQGISAYIGEIINDLSEKGVPYEKMNGLADYLADKVEDSPLLWNVSVANVYADTADILTRSSEYNVSLKISSAEGLNTHINVEISKEYIDEKMVGMLLVFAVTFAVALIMIFELLKLPDAMFTRISRNFRESRSVQAGAVAPVLRLGSFIAYTGMYVGIPFSSVLITQWNKSIFGLSVTFLASIPMTAELLATMLCSLLLLPVYRKMDLRLVFTVSALISAAANVMCFFAGSPEQLILLRFCSGIGFAGIKYSLNTIVSLGSLSPENTTDNLAALNAGLLGGITCGGTLGAVIASSINVHTSYLIAGVFIFAFAVAVLALSPWKLFRANGTETESGASGSRFGALSLIVKPSFLRYALLVAIPMNFGLMFVVAFFPSFVGSLGLPDVTTSYGYLINGLVGIYVGPVLLKALSGKIGKSACVVISLLLAAASVLILNINAPLVIVLVSVAVLGLFDGFGTPATSDYYVNMPVVKKAGVSQGLAMLNVIGSIVQTFSPVLYSAVLAGGAAAMNIMGIAFIAAAVLFIITIRMNSEKVQKADIVNK